MCAYKLDVDTGAPWHYRPEDVEGGLEGNGFMAWNSELPCGILAWTLSVSIITAGDLVNQRPRSTLSHYTINRIVLEYVPVVVGLMVSNTRRIQARTCGVWLYSFLVVIIVDVAS